MGDEESQGQQHVEELLADGGEVAQESPGLSGSEECGLEGAPAVAEGGLGSLDECRVEVAPPPPRQAVEEEGNPTSGTFVLSVSASLEVKLPTRLPPGLFEEEPAAPGAAFAVPSSQVAPFSEQPEEEPAAPGAAFAVPSSQVAPFSEQPEEGPAASAAASAVSEALGAPLSELQEEGPSASAAASAVSEALGASLSEPEEGPAASAAASAVSEALGAPLSELPEEGPAAPAAASHLEAPFNERLEEGLAAPAAASAASSHLEVPFSELPEDDSSKAAVVQVERLVTEHASAGLARVKATLGAFDGKADAAVLAAPAGLDGEELELEALRAAAEAGAAGAQPLARDLGEAAAGASDEDGGPEVGRLSTLPGVATNALFICYVDTSGTAVQVVAQATMAHVATVTSSGARVVDLALQAEDSHLLTAFDDGRVIVLRLSTDAAAARVLLKFEGPPVQAVLWHPANPRVFLTLHAERALLWHLQLIGQFSTLRPSGYEPLEEEGVQTALQVTPELVENATSEALPQVPQAGSGPDVKRLQKLLQGAGSQGTESDAMVQEAGGPLQRATFGSDGQYLMAITSRVIWLWQLKSKDQQTPPRAVCLQRHELPEGLAGSINHMRLVPRYHPDGTPQYIFMAVTAHEVLFWRLDPRPSGGTGYWLPFGRLLCPVQQRLRFPWRVSADVSLPWGSEDWPKATLVVALEPKEDAQEESPLLIVGELVGGEGRSLVVPSLSVLRAPALPGHSGRWRLACLRAFERSMRAKALPEGVEAPTWAVAALALCPGASARCLCLALPRQPAPSAAAWEAEEQMLESQEASEQWPTPEPSESGAEWEAAEEAQERPAPAAASAVPLLPPEPREPPPAPPMSCSGAGADAVLWAGREVQAPPGLGAPLRPPPGLESALEVEDSVLGLLGTMLAEVDASPEAEQPPPGLETPPPEGEEVDTLPEVEQLPPGLETPPPEGEEAESSGSPPAEPEPDASPGEEPAAESGDQGRGAAGSKKYKDDDRLTKSMVRNLGHFMENRAGKANQALLDTISRKIPSRVSGCSSRSGRRSRSREPKQQELQDTLQTVVKECTQMAEEVARAEKQSVQTLKKIADPEAVKAATNSKVFRDAIEKELSKWRDSTLCKAVLKASEGRAFADQFADGLRGNPQETAALLQHQPTPAQLQKAVQADLKEWCTNVIARYNKGLAKEVGLPQARAGMEAALKEVATQTLQDLDRTLQEMKTTSDAKHLLEVCKSDVSTAVRREVQKWEEELAAASAAAAKGGLESIRRGFARRMQVHVAPLQRVLDNAALNLRESGAALERCKTHATGVEAALATSSRASSSRGPSLAEDRKAVFGSLASGRIREAFERALGWEAQNKGSATSLVELTCRQLQSSQPGKDGEAASHEELTNPEEVLARPEVAAALDSHLKLLLMFALLQRAILDDAPLDRIEANLDWAFGLLQVVDTYAEGDKGLPATIEAVRRVQPGVQSALELLRKGERPLALAEANPSKRREVASMARLALKGLDVLARVQLRS